MPVLTEPVSFDFPSSDDKCDDIERIDKPVTENSSASVPAPSGGKQPSCSPPSDSSAAATKDGGGGGCGGGSAPVATDAAHSLESELVEDTEHPRHSPPLLFSLAAIGGWWSIAM